MIADLHSHYPIHLVPQGEADPVKLRSHWRR
jgi:hypothetical protein